MAEIRWIKIVTNIFDNRKIKQIETLPDGDTIIVIWFKLLCLTGQINDNGCVYLTQEVPYTEEMLSTEFNRPLKTIQLAMSTFQAFGMIEIIDNIYHISNWENYQNIEGMERVREQTRNRVAKFRERQKEQKLLNESKDVTENVTLRNATDKNRIDKDIYKENIIKEKLKKTNFDLIIEEEKFSNETVERLNDFIKMRKSIKKPLTDRALKIAINKLKKFSNSEEEMRAILDRSILNSWQDLYELKPEDKKKFIKTDKIEYKVVEMTEAEYFGQGGKMKYE